jgi:hypothetical protein
MTIQMPARDGQVLPIRGDKLDRLVATLTDDELAAAGALYSDGDIEVGREGIGGFCGPDQAERTIAVLKLAGFEVHRK